LLTTFINHRHERDVRARAAKVESFDSFLASELRARAASDLARLLRECSRTTLDGRSADAFKPCAVSAAEALRQALRDCRVTGIRTELMFPPGAGISERVAEIIRLYYKIQSELNTFSERLPWGEDVSEGVSRSTLMDDALERFEALDEERAAKVDQLVGIVHHALWPSLFGFRQRLHLARHRELQEPATRVALMGSAAVARADSPAVDLDTDIGTDRVRRGQPLRLPPDQLPDDAEQGSWEGGTDPEGS